MPLWGSNNIPKDHLQGFYVWVLSCGAGRRELLGVPILDAPTLWYNALSQTHFDCPIFGPKFSITPVAHLKIYMSFFTHYMIFHRCNGIAAASSWWATVTLFKQNSQPLTKNSLGIEHMPVRFLYVRWYSRPAFSSCALRSYAIWQRSCTTCQDWFRWFTGLWWLRFW